MDDLKEFQCVLEKSICETADEEYRRLSRDMSIENQFKNIKEALESLGKLQKGEEPEYNEWQALFYLTWYHFSHVNLAIAILRDIKKIQIDFPIHLVDLACGTLATQFALSYCLSRRSDTEHPSTTAVIYNTDKSKPMLKLGSKLWRKFTKIAKNTDSAISYGCNSIKMKCNPSHGKDLYIENHARRYLFVMHGVYGNNKIKIREEICKAIQRFKPESIIMTCHIEKKHLLEYCIENTKEINVDKISYEAGKITNWRRNLLKKFPGADCNDIVSRYLQSDVPSWPAKPVVRWKEPN